MCRKAFRDLNGREIVVLAAITRSDYLDFSFRLGLDLAAILLVSVGLYLPRHRRRDLFLVFVVFNLGVFCVLSVITERKISSAVGFGLFALLSIVRLRSQPYANVELSYFFASLVLGVVNGIGHTDRWFKVMISALIVLGLFMLDHPSIQRVVQRRRVILDAVYTDPAVVRAELERRFGVRIVELLIRQVDYVRETTSVSMGYVEKSPSAASSLFSLEDAEERDAE